MAKTGKQAKIPKYKYELRLYIAGKTPNALAALNNLKK